MVTDDHTVILTRREFNALDEWDTELPQSPKPGRKFKRRVHDGTGWTERFMMGEFVGQGKGRPLTLVWREVIEITP